MLQCQHVQRERQGQDVIARNPYNSPIDTDASARVFDRRIAFLLLPPLIPLLVHGVVRVIISADESLYHAMFRFWAIIPAWIWANTMVGRLRFSYWKTYLVTCAVWGAVVASALIAPVIVNRLTVGP